MQEKIGKWVYHIELKRATIEAKLDYSVAEEVDLSNKNLSEQCAPTVQGYEAQRA
jgi:hypothetical protein